MFIPSDTPISARPEHKERVERLLTMLTYKRKAFSKSEAAWIERFINPLQSHPNTSQFCLDSFGNIFIEVCGGSDLLMTAHTDSVHGEEGLQEVLFDANLGVAYKNDQKPLGADDGAGVWLMQEMLDAGVPCWLAFFRAEEIGGQGSDFAAKDNPEFFQAFKWCVSLDRRGTSDVITHQGFSRCASEVFASHLSSALNECGLDYKPCDGGIFTDSANLTGLIAECTNLSVGYNAEHTGMEELDVDHLLNLRDALVSIDWQSLPAVREPGEDDFAYDRMGFGRLGFAGDYRRSLSASTTRYASRIRVADLYDMTREEMVDAMIEDPDGMADAVWDMLWGDAVPMGTFNDEEM